MLLRMLKTKLLMDFVNYREGITPREKRQYNNKLRRKLDTIISNKLDKEEMQC